MNDIIPSKLTDGIGPIEYTGATGADDVNILGFLPDSVGRHVRFCVTLPKHLSSLTSAMVSGINSVSPVNAKASIVSTIPSESDSTATFSALSEVDVLVPVQHVPFLTPYGAWGGGGITYRTTNTTNTLFIYERTDFVTSDPP